MELPNSLGKPWAAWLPFPLAKARRLLKAVTGNLVTTFVEFQSSFHTCLDWNIGIVISN